MRNQDKRFDRYMNDNRFATMVKHFEQLLYSDTRVTYDEILDAAFVAYVKYREANPASTLNIYKQSPFVFIETDQNYQQTERSKVMNAALELGFKSRDDIRKLVAMLEVARECLEKVGTDRTLWGTIAREALARIDKELENG